MPRPRRGAGRPRVFRTLHREALHRASGPTGEVGRLHSGAGFELVWVTKELESVDPEWFSLPTVDVLIVVQGRLRVEFEDRAIPPELLGPGDVLVLPPRTRCRAYRWPRSARRATVFVAVYPVGRGRRR